MRWIRIEDTLPDHRKTLALSTALKLDRDAVSGKLLRLWLWTINHRPDGAFDKDAAKLLPEIMRLKKRPDTIVQLLIDTKFMDEVEGGYSIHDWDERASALLDRLERTREQTRRRVQKFRSCNAIVTQCNDDVTRYSNADVTRYSNADVTQCNAHTEQNITEQNKEIKEIKQNARARRTPARFIPPSVEEVRAYCQERRNGVDPEKFVDFYTSNGWMVGKNKMRDWKAAVRGPWERDEKKFKPVTNEYPDER